MIDDIWYDIQYMMIIYMTAYLGKLLGIGQIVNSNGQEDIKQSVCYDRN